MLGSVTMQESWRILEILEGLPGLGDLPYPGLEPKSPASPALQADSLPLSHLGDPESRLWQPKGR